MLIIYRYSFGYTSVSYYWSKLYNESLIYSSGPPNAPNDIFINGPTVVWLRAIRAVYLVLCQPISLLIVSPPNSHLLRTEFEWWLKIASRKRLSFG